MYNLDDDLKKFFPTLDFKLKDMQKRVITTVVDEGNTLCLMPTGGGKSVIYWMSAMEIKGISIVVSPLTALIAEQADKLRGHGYEVLAIHGGVSAKKQMTILKDFANHKVSPHFIFLSPEKIATDGFLEYCLKTRKDDIKLVVIDEVHCVSQWGISFRPFYKRIPQFMNELFGTDQWARVLALTATLNSKEVKDICDAFRIEKQNIIMQDLLMRSEIQLHVQKFADENEKTEKFWHILKTHQDEKILVYVYRKYKKHGVEDLCSEAVQRGFRAVSFHGDMTFDERSLIIDKFKKNEINIVFATNAFGMGIDIRDIRTVIHFMIPESVEQYYQEVGRAARDGHGANAYLLYTNKNIEVKRKYFIDQSFPSEDKLRNTFRKIAGRTGYQTLPYFEDEELQQCLPYYLESGLITIVCKGFSDLKSLSDIEDPRLQSYYDSTKGKSFIRTAKVNGTDPRDLATFIYSSIIRGKVAVSKPLERWLVIDVCKTDIEEEDMRFILKDINEKRKYKHELMDYLVYLLENNSNTLHLHQEIATYLGTPKHSLNRIYVTTDGNRVRSKSEVIISDLLSEEKLKYEYEKKLFYDAGKWVEPDFTVYLNNGTEIYWEHVGMLGKEEYDLRWAEKIDIYNRYYPGQMIKTYESGVLSRDAKHLIDELKNLTDPIHKSGSVIPVTEQQRL